MIKTPKKVEVERNLKATCILKKNTANQAWWLTPVILFPWKSGIGRIMVPGQPQQKNF
jgi:hypothetical protein